MDIQSAPFALIFVGHDERTVGQIVVGGQIVVEEFYASCDAERFAKHLMDQVPQKDWGDINYLGEYRARVKNESLIIKEAENMHDASCKLCDGLVSSVRTAFNVMIRDRKRQLANSEDSVLTLAEAVAHQPNELGLEIIPIPSDGRHEMVLLRSALVSWAAFLLYTENKKGTKWQLRFKIDDSTTSRKFSLPCLCCTETYQPIDYTVPTGQWSKQEKTKDQATFKDAFHRSIGITCRNNGIGVVFARDNFNEEKKNPLTGATFMDGSLTKIRSFFTEECDRETACLALSFIASMVD